MKIIINDVYLTRVSKFGFEYKNKYDMVMIFI
jgi:hypothetical protein